MKPTKKDIKILVKQNNCKGEVFKIAKRNADFVSTVSDEDRK